MGIGDPGEGVTYNITASGGVRVNSTATLAQVFSPTTGVVVGGISLVFSGFFSTGGSVVSGEAVVQYEANPVRLCYDIDNFDDATGVSLSDHKTSLGHTWVIEADTLGHFIQPSGFANSSPSQPNPRNEAWSYLDFDTTAAAIVRAGVLISNPTGYSVFSVAFLSDPANSPGGHFEDNFVHVQISPDNINMRVLSRDPADNPLDEGEELASVPLFSTPAVGETWKFEIEITPTTITAIVKDNSNKATSAVVPNIYGMHSRYGIFDNVGAQSWDYFCLDIPSLNGGYGGVAVGGTAGVTQNIADFITASGVVVTGSSRSASFYYPPDGAVVVGGEAPVTSGLVGTGGAVVAGQTIVTFYDYVDGEGGVVVGGRGNVNVYRIIKYFPVGNIIRINGEAKYGLNPVYNANGGVFISGASSARTSFNIDYQFLWHTRANVIRDLTFLWNLGKLPIFWYRIIGKCRDGDKCNLIADPCRQRFIANVHARTLAELCDKLRQRRFILPIESVQRFSTPAEGEVAALLEQAGEDLSCNELTPVEICHIPACFDFCVDFDVRVTFKLDIIRVQLAFLEHEAEGSIFLGGCATVKLFRNLPSFSYTSTGGLTLNGTSVVSASDYTVNGDGGVIISGSSDRAFSAWTYCGGEWPHDSGVLRATDSTSLPVETTDQIWSLTERALLNDGLYSSSDISFGKTSDFLIIKNFGLNVPSDDILGIKVQIDRLATQVNVRDAEVYLVIGDQVVSDNLAKATDWPFVETVSVYGSSGFDGLMPWRDPNSEDYVPWTAAEINNPEFGVALRVKAHTSLAITIAKVDFISVQVFSENPQHQRLRVGGQPHVVSSSWKYASSNGVKIEGEVDFPLYGAKFISSGGFVIGGHSGLHTNGDSGGGVILSGSAIEQYEKLHFFGEGGATLDGTAVVIPYYLDFEGGIKTGGVASLKTIVNESGKGGVKLGGVLSFDYESSGGVFISGTSTLVSSAWHYTSEEGVIIGGEGDLGSSHLGFFFDVVEFQMNITDLEIFFDSDRHEGDAGRLPDSVVQCGCNSIPFLINFEHNFTRDNNLTKFLQRNNLSLPTRFQMAYNSTNNSWQQNYHFKGFSPSAPTQEVWDVVFELQCTSVVGAIEIGREIWRIAIEVFRKNLDTGRDFDTRILFGIYKEPICNTSSNELAINVIYDTQADVAVINPESTIYQTLLYDNIGLFKTPRWITNPDLIISVSQAGLPFDQIRVDLTDEVLLL